MTNPIGLNKFTNVDTEIPFSFSKHSSIGVGGNAKIGYFPKTIPACTALLCYLRKENIHYQVVGNMTNVLPMDGERDTVIVCTKKLNGTQTGKSIFVEAGVMSGAFLNACRSAKLSGGEFLVGIPCTIGGALYMNAGVREGYMADIVDSVLVWREGKTEILSLSECAYSYKHSVFMQNKDVILGATFRLTESDSGKIEEKKRYFLEKRAHLPKGKSMGCVFKNPSGYFAGGLIENAGLKGFRIGGAHVSKTHANFILNDKNATAKDIMSLITLIKKRVFEKYNVELQEEIRYLK